MNDNQLETVKIRVYRSYDSDFAFVSSDRLLKNIIKEVQHVLHKYDIRTEVIFPELGKGGGFGELWLDILQLIHQIKGLISLLTFFIKLASLIKWSLSHQVSLGRLRKRPEFTVVMLIESEGLDRVDYDYAVSSSINNLLYFSEEIQRVLNDNFPSLRFARRIQVRLVQNNFNLSVLLPHSKSGQVDKRIFKLVQNIPTRDSKHRVITPTKYGLIKRNEIRQTRSKIRRLLKFKASNTYYTFVSTRVLDDYIVFISKRRDKKRELTKLIK